MIIGTKFENDNHHWVKDIQQDCYDITPIFKAASRAYRYAELLLETKTDLGYLISKVEFLDHRTLQNVHDLIAAKFRKDYAEEFHPKLFEQVDENTIRNKWLNYYQKSIKNHCQDPAFVINVLTASIYKNPDKRGTEAENELNDMLKVSDSL